MFGFATFGRVYGTIICLSGLINLSQTGIDALTKSTFDGNPIPVNTFLAGTGFIVGSALVIFVGVQGHRLRKKLEEEDRMTYTETTSIMDSLLEDDDRRFGYGSFNYRDGSVVGSVRGGGSVLGGSVRGHDHGQE